MRKDMWTKGVVLGIIILFVGAGVVPSICAVDINNDKEEIMQTSEQGLIGYWNFNEGSGNIVSDTSGYGNDGTRVGASWVNGTLGSALEITDEEYVTDIPSSFDDPITTAFTITAWVKWYGFDTYPEEVIIIFDGRADQPRGFLFYIQRNTGLLGLHLNRANTSIYSESAFPIGSWTFVVGVFNDETNTMRLYINGVQDQTAIVSSQYLDSYHEAMIGNNHWGVWAPLNGIVDELRLYNRELSGDEILDLYNILEFSIQGGHGINLNIKNIGPSNAINVDWQINVKGGLLGLINVTKSGTIDTIVFGELITVGTGMFLGLGKIQITIKVDEDTKTANGTQLFIFTKIL
jgi:hypothetical protein